MVTQKNDENLKKNIGWESYSPKRIRMHSAAKTNVKNKRNKAQSEYENKEKMEIKIGVQKI